MSEKIVSLGGQEVTLRIVKKGAIHHITSPERTDTIEILALRDGEAELRINDRRAIVPYIIDGSTIHFWYDGETYRAEVTVPGRRGRSRHREHSMSAPMPSVVLKISVKEGDVVSRGATLIVLEAMKMEHQIAAPYDAIVAAIHCREGELVQPGVDLIELRASDENQR